MVGVDGAATNTPDSGTKLPVPTPINAATKNKAVVDRSPKGNHTMITTNRVKTFIARMVFKGPSRRSASQGGRLLPKIAPLKR